MSSPSAPPMAFWSGGADYEAHSSAVDASVAAVLKSGWFIGGPNVTAVEEKLAALAGTKHALGTASGTDSLQMALMALDIGPGDEVVTVPFTWISTAEVIPIVGATPVFVDIEEDSYNLDPTKLEAAITPKTKAVIVVSLFGQPANMEAINEIASRHDVAVIEDAAQSFGSTRGGKPSCGLGATISITSFFPTKPLGCYGDGGAIFTDDDALANRIAAIRNHGANIRDEHWCVGFTGRLDALQAAVLLAKLPKLDDIMSCRTALGSLYTRLIAESGLQGVVTPHVVDGNTHVYAQYTIRVPSERRNELREKMKAQGVPTAVYYPKCLHLQKTFEGRGGGAEGDFPVSEKASKEVMSLPFHPYMSEDEAKRAVDALVAAFK